MQTVNGLQRQLQDPFQGMMKRRTTGDGIKESRSHPYTRQEHMHAEWTDQRDAWVELSRTIVEDDLYVASRDAAEELETFTMALHAQLVASTMDHPFQLTMKSFELRTTSAKRAALTAPMRWSEISPRSERS